MSVTRMHTSNRMLAGAARSVRAPIVLAAALVWSACSMGVEGSFDGVTYNPGPHVLAVADRNTLLSYNGAVIAVRRADDDMRLHALFTAAPVDPQRHWLHAPADVLHDVRRGLATHDGLLLENIPLGRFADGDELVAVLEHGEQSGDFMFALGMARPTGDQERPLGSRIQVSIKPSAQELSARGGLMAADVTIVRERETGQDSDAAAGRFTLRFSTPLQPERLTEANLAVAAPVLACMQRVGAGDAARCASEEPLPVADANGVVPESASRSR